VVPQRRNEALGDHEYRAPVSDAGADLPHRRGQRRAWDRQDHKVHGGELDVRDGADPYSGVQPDAGEVALLLPGALDAIRLYQRAAPELHV